MNIFIKNMVCNRCVMVVRHEFEKAGLNMAKVHLGEVELVEEPTAAQLKEVGERLQAWGFEILEGQKQKQIEKIKSLLTGKVQKGEIEEHFSLSDFLSDQLHKEYTQISRLFSQTEGITIEQYFILQKIEKVKEWLFYEELTLNEIAWKLGYSSVAHLSAQFKKVTGLSPSLFKKERVSHRRPLDQTGGHKKI